MGEKRTPKVYIVNRAGHNYQAAAKYGELVYVTKGYLRHFSVGQHTRTWAEALADSQPEDYIILSSINVVCGIGCALFAMMHGRLNLLLWNNKNEAYIKREVLLDELLAVKKKTPLWAVPLLRSFADEAKKEEEGGE